MPESTEADLTLHYAPRTRSFTALPALPAEEDHLTGGSAHE
jgi:hypothetical protein